MFTINQTIFLKKATPLMCLGLLLCVSFQLKAQSLDELKTISAENNIALQAQFKTFEAQLEAVAQAKSWQDPNLSFGYFISPIETRVGPQIARFSLSQMLPWFGTLKAKGEVAAYRAEAEYEKFQDQKLKLFLEVAEKYYDLASLRQIYQLEAEQLSILEGLKTIVKANYENNRADLVDVLRVDLNLEKQTNVLQVLKEQDKAMVTQLNRLLNRSLHTTILIPNTIQQLEWKENTATDTLPKNHPRLEILRKMQASNLAEAVVAQKQAMPQLGFGLDYAIIQDRNVMNADAGQDAFMPMLSVSLPIFGKKNKARKKMVALQGEALQLQLEDEEDQILTEIRVTALKQEELFSLLHLFEKQRSQLKDMLQLAEASLANATLSIEEVLRLQDERLLYEKQYVKTLASLQKNKETLGYLTSNTE